MFKKRKQKFIEPVEESQIKSVSHHPGQQTLVQSPRSVPPKPGNLPPKPIGIAPKPGKLPPKPGNLPPKPGNLPPKPVHVAPKPGNLPPKPATLPPKPIGIAPKPGKLPPKPVNLPPKPVNLPPQPIGGSPKLGNPEYLPPKPSNVSPMLVNLPCTLGNLPPCTSGVENEVSHSSPRRTIQSVSSVPSNKQSNLPKENIVSESKIEPEKSKSPFRIRKGTLSKGMNLLLHSPRDKSPRAAEGKSIKKELKPLRKTGSSSYITRKQKTLKVLWKFVDPVARGPHPEWEFQAISVPAEDTFDIYNGVKISCMYRTGDELEPIGSIMLAFGSDIPNPPTPSEISFSLQGTSKKAKPPGTITVRSLFTGKESTRDILVQSDPTALKSLAIKKSSLIHITASGRREIRYNAEGMNMVFGELPPIHVNEKPSNDHGYNATVALWLVTCCQLAYRDKIFIGEVVRNVWDMYDFIVFEHQDSDTRGFCFHNDEILIVCFRGTDSIQNWITNLKFIMVSPNKLPIRYQKLGIQVHTGFYEAVNHVFPEIKRFIDKAYNVYPTLKLYICGHSLGGALAQLCFGNLALSNTPRRVSAVYTVGQPRAANKKFKELVEQISPETTYIRITNNQDCVPSLANGQHCGVLVHIKACGEFSFDPPTWKKAIASAHAMQSSAASLSYAAIADHLTGVYRKRIENYWLKFQSARISADDGAFGLCEQILILSDFLVEDVKFVRRYKPQFRAIIHQVIKSRTLIVQVQNFLGGGAEITARNKLVESLKGFFEALSNLRKSIQERQSKLSVLQQVSSSEKAFNAEMTNQCATLQIYCDDINQYMKRTSVSVSKKNVFSQLMSGYSWMEAPKLEKYDPRSYDIQFNTIHFDTITKKMKQQVCEQVPISKLLEFAEEMVEEGKYNQALRVLEETKAKGGDVFSPEDHIQFEYLSAQAHAQLDNYQEAMKSLNSLSESGVEIDATIMQASAFSKLKSIRGFSALEKRFLSKKKKIKTKQDEPGVVASLNNFELHSLSRMFDEADVSGNNCLTKSDLEALIEKLGGLNEILFGLDWFEASTDKIDIYQTILFDIQSKYQNAIDLDQFIHLMSRLMPL